MHVFQAATKPNKLVERPRVCINFRATRLATSLPSINSIDRKHQSKPGFGHGALAGLAGSPDRAVVTMTWMGPTSHRRSLEKLELQKALQEALLAECISFRTHITEERVFGL